MRIDLYTDTVCPWCFVAQRRLAQALADRPQYEPRLRWRAFELNPDLPPDGVERAWFLHTRVGDRRRLAETEATLAGLGGALGIHFRFDLIARVPNTRLSHLLLAQAARCGRQGEVADRIMRAYFEEGGDIGDLDELVRLGVEAGLSEYETRRALVLRAGLDAVVAAERHAAVLGLNAVPAFIIDGIHTVSGAHETESLARALDQAAEAGVRAAP